MVRALLDLIIDETQFAGTIRTRQGPVWLVIHPDGLSQTVTTPRVSPISTAHFNMPIRLLLSVPSLSAGYLKVSLHGLSRDWAGVEVLATSQIKLMYLPTGTAKEFRFPLIRKGTTSEEAAVVSARGVISEIAFMEAATRSTYAGEGKTVHRQEQLQSTYPSGPWRPAGGEIPHPGGGPPHFGGGGIRQTYRNVPGRYPQVV